jgi:hypothetical protein
VTVNGRCYMGEITVPETLRYADEPATIGARGRTRNAGPESFHRAFHLLFLDSMSFTLVRLIEAYMFDSGWSDHGETSPISRFALVAIYESL